MAAKTEKLRAVQNKSGEWKWHLVGRNGKKSGCGGETFTKPMTEKKKQRLIQMLINSEIERVPYKKKN